MARTAHKTGVEQLIRIERAPAAHCVRFLRKPRRLQWRAVHSIASSIVIGIQQLTWSWSIATRA